MNKAFYTIRGIAEKLSVSEKTIYRMLGDQQIPFAVKIGGQWRFRADAFDTWLQSRTGQETGQERSDAFISIHQGLRQGAILHHIHGSNRDEAISDLLAALPYSPAIDQQATKLSIFTREALASSSMQGIAYMGISVERPLSFPTSMVLLAFLEEPADFMALDGIATELFFLVLPANRGEQAILEMRLQRLAQDQEFQQAIRRQRSGKEILATIQRLEERIFPPREKGAEEKKEKRTVSSSNVQALGQGPSQSA